MRPEIEALSRPKPKAGTRGRCPNDGGSDIEHQKVHWNLNPLNRRSEGHNASLSLSIRKGIACNH